MRADCHGGRSKVEDLDATGVDSPYNPNGGPQKLEKPKRWQLPLNVTSGRPNPSELIDRDSELLTSRSNNSNVVKQTELLGGNGHSPPGQVGKGLSPRGAAASSAEIGVLTGRSRLAPPDLSRKR